MAARAVLTLRLATNVPDSICLFLGVLIGHHRTNRGQSGRSENEHPASLAGRLHDYPTLVDLKIAVLMRQTAAFEGKATSIPG